MSSRKESVSSSSARRLARPRPARAQAAPDGAGATAAVDRSRFVPLYFQIAEILKDRIDAGTWSAGDRFPSERELIEEFGVSRTAIRPALDLLESDGQLVRVKGRGTFVAAPKTPLGVAGLAHLLSHPLPDGTAVRILAAARQRPEPYVRETLGIGRGRVRNVTALILREGVPMFLCDSFSSVDDLPWLDADVDRRATLAAGDPPPGRIALGPAALQIETASLSHWEAEQLQAPAGASCYLVRCIEHARGRGRGASPRAVEVARVVYRSERVRLEIAAARR